MAPTRPDRDAVRRGRPPNSLRPGSDFHTDLYQRQPAGVEVGCFKDAGGVEAAPTDRDLSASQMCSHRAAIHAEPRGQLHERRALAVLRHHIVDLLGAKEGLSHPK